MAPARKARWQRGAIVSVDAASGRGAATSRTDSAERIQYSSFVEIMYLLRIIFIITWLGSFGADSETFFF